mgnify:FL=1
MENSYGVYTHLNSTTITKKCLLFLGHDIDVGFATLLLQLRTFDGVKSLTSNV